VAKERKTKKDLIAEELKMLIGTGQLPRGARIQQDELAARFETSITPVREALRQLEAQGLLVSEPHRGVRVAEANLDEVKGVYVTRRLVEPYAAQRATLRVSRRDLGRAEELVDAMDAARRDGNDTGVRDANREFHFLFYERSGIPALVRIIDGLWLSFPWDILQVISGRLDSSIDEHRAMVDAVRGGDVEQVKTAFEEHIARSYISLCAHLDRGAADDPFELSVD
jgi:DNA-binding GntR family transcriptional regulator